MLIRTVLCGLLVTLSTHPVLRAIGTPVITEGWYNGDCHSSGVGGWPNWYVSNQEFVRTYDKFLVPVGGWVVTGVFSNNEFMGSVPPITQAAWEIRSGMASGNGGTVMASGVNPAIQTLLAGTYPPAYRIEVTGLRIPLPAGDYVLNVTPVGTVSGQSFVCET